MRQHPDFDLAITRYLAILSDQREKFGPARKFYASYQRSEILYAILYLHFTADPYDLDSEPSFVKVLEIFRSRGGISPRILRTVLGIAAKHGLLRTRRGLADRRRTVYIPTARLIEDGKVWFTALISAIDALNPEVGHAEKFMANPRLFKSYLVSVFRPYFLHATPLAEKFPEFRRLLKFDGAVTVYCAYACDYLQGKPLPNGREVAARFQIPVSQVRALLLSAREAGLIEIDEFGRVVSVERLTEAGRHVIAREMAIIARFALDIS